MMHHQQYREGLLSRLRDWKLSNIDGTIGACRTELRPKVTEADVDLLFDNWLNNNFDRVEVHEFRPGSFVAEMRPKGRARDPDQPRRVAVAAQRLLTQMKSNVFEDFAARIWDTMLPNGVALRDATGKDMRHASGWFAELGKKMKPTEKVINKFTIRQLFDLSQREKFTA